MFGCLINRVRHTKEKFLSNEEGYIYYILLTSSNESGPYICVAIGRTEGELNLNIDKKTYNNNFRYLVKLTSKKETHLVGLRSSQIVELIESYDMDIVEHKFSIIF